MKRRMIVGAVLCLGLFFSLGKPVYASEVEADETETVSENSDEVFYPIDHSDDLYEQYVETLFFPEDEDATLDEEVYRGNTISDYSEDRITYKILMREGEKIANGQREDTCIRIYFDDLVGEMGGPEYRDFGFTLSELGYTYTPSDSEIKQTLYEMILPSYNAIFDAVFLDRADLFYWTNGYGISSSRGSLKKSDRQGITRYKLEGAYIDFNFVVCGYYKKSGSVSNYKVDTAKTGAAYRALDNARSIINTAQTSSSYNTDYKKLCYYRDRICDLNTYNDDAASGSWDMSDWNPWRIIYVFDGDPSTNVVCEGYSRAFKYLVDNTTFSSSYVTCDAVSGDMKQYRNGNYDSGGGHMWCTVRMDDGKRYFADITGCDSNKNLFFLRGVSEITQGGSFKGYQITSGSYTCKYLYDSDTLSLYSSDELKCSSSNYNPDHGSPAGASKHITSVYVSRPADQIYVSGKSIEPLVTLKDNGRRLVEGRDYRVSYANNRKCGKASVIINGMGNYYGSGTVNFNIVPDTPMIESVKIVRNNGSGVVRIKWNCTIEGAICYVLYRNGESIDPVLPASPGNFDDTTCKTGCNSYVLQAFYVDDNDDLFGSGYSNEVEIYVPPADQKTNNNSGDSNNNSKNSGGNKTKPGVGSNNKNSSNNSSSNNTETPSSRTSDQSKQIEAFVMRMYTVALGRSYDKQGLINWSSKLENGYSDGAAIANGFIFSKEFENRRLNDSQYVDTLYRTFFNREPDDNGKMNWMLTLARGGSRESVLAGFVNSVEFGNLCDRYGIARGTMEPDGSSIFNSGVRDFVLRNYEKALGRKGETAGVEDWSHRINTGQMSALDVAQNFFHSEEFYNKHTSNEEFVEILYETFLGRKSEANGKAYWVYRLNSGVSRDEVMSGFAYSQEFHDIMARYGL